ncbi:hypothetical protein NEUTE1DRAFT_51513 [Neurospora tetrasperma FGSC 2508]|uniref:Uncharacterized protein n=1 Tax=Neurospora tetrasperma (strain FGSC 2508 / ATCC MYA-4615 / P0657) TaxID=510951 RepID=F8MYH0_NEUT8|nr:uncharacterized protein NEUTE1DRAFT_51513 [Neurospora tetrasperma FGSC 2508]EGO51367.1 hypothetical protein NEUTE1DRAFT_51513 [Neurospora tetrasperma FGSC 2508]EGZ78664.1 hypothetical protein NEUTE2DRAFT_50625 [Neurospora tetrasperma FGSC 2509]
MPDFDFEAAKESLAGYITLFGEAAGESDGSLPWTIFLHATQKVNTVAQSLQERLEECRTEFDQIKSHREEIAARERAVEQQEANAQQTLQQAEDKDRETQEKLNQLAENRRQHQDHELQLNTRQMELDSQKEQQGRELQALNEEKAVVAREKQDVARNQNTLGELRKEIEERVRAQIRLDDQLADFQRVTSVLEQQFPSILEQQLAPALQKLDNVSARVQAIEGLMERTSHLQDRLESAQNTATQTTSIIEQQLATALNQLESVSGQVQAIQRVVEDLLKEQLEPALDKLQNVPAGLQAIERIISGIGRLDDRLVSTENTTRMTEKEHDRMIMELRAEIITAVYLREDVRELRQAVDDIRKVPEL